MTDPAVEPVPAPGTSARTVAIVVLGVLAVLYTLYFARTFLIPIAFAILLDFLLSPAVRLLERLRIPNWLGAAIVVLGLVGFTAFGVYRLSGPVQSWMADLPRTLSKAQREIQKLTAPLQGVSETAKKVEEATEPTPPGDQPTEVVVVGPSVISRVFGSTQRLLAAMLEVLILLYFLLAGGDLFLEKVIRVIPSLTDKKKAVRIARETESAISTYLLANLGINLVEGVMVGLAMWALGMPNPVLWGVLTVIFEFIPYLGALIMIALLTLSALVTFDNIGQILLVPAAFMLANLIQANIVTTLVLGKKLALNNVALFVGLAFWWWIWGIPGAFIGVPLMAVFKIYCDHIEALAPVGEFLGARAPQPSAISHQPAATEG
jgi:predicted PurR-regulated permease PerM